MGVWCGNIGTLDGVHGELKVLWSGSFNRPVAASLVSDLLGFIVGSLSGPLVVLG